MSTHFSMGAVEIETSNHVYPAVALKGRNYKCPECQNPVIFRNGKIKAKHFAHKANSNCSFYDHPNESQLHREAKRQMCAHLNNKRSLIIQRKCLTCPRMKEYELSKFYTQSCCAKEEHNFDYNNSKYSADVALLDNDKILLICEILHTHKTAEDRRPEPWVEVRSIDVINQINDTRRIECMRAQKICESCEKNALEREQKRKKEEKQQHKKWLEGAEERAEKQKKIFEEERKREEERIQKLLEEQEKRKKKKIEDEKETKKRWLEERKEREKKCAAEALIRKEQYDKEREMEQNYFFKALEEIRKEEQDKTINPP